VAQPVRLRQICLVAPHLEPDALASHWSRIIGIPTGPLADGGTGIVLPNCMLRFAKGGSDAMTGLTFRVDDISAIRKAATAKGYAITDDAFRIAGIDCRLAR
jgi:hypothetical protein